MYLVLSGILLLVLLAWTKRQGLRKKHQGFGGKNRECRVHRRRLLKSIDALHKQGEAPLKTIEKRLEKRLAKDEKIS